MQPHTTVSAVFLHFEPDLVERMSPCGSAIDYDDALTAKIFVFQFVNSYLALFITAYLLGRVDIGGYKPMCESAPGVPESCMIDVGALIQSTMFTNVLIGNFLESVLPYYLHKKAHLAKPQSSMNSHPDSSHCNQGGTRNGGELRESRGSGEAF